MQNPPGDPPPLTLGAVAPELDDGEIARALAGIKLHGWTCDYDYPGYLVFDHPDSAVSVIMTSDWEGTPDTLDVQLQGPEDYVEGGAVLTAWKRGARTLVNFCALVSPLLAAVHEEFHSGLADFYEADEITERPRRVAYYCEICESINRGHTCCEYQGEKD